MTLERKPYRDPTADSAIRAADEQPRQSHKLYFADSATDRIVAFAIKPLKQKPGTGLPGQYRLRELLSQYGSSWQPITNEEYIRLQTEDAKRQVSWKELRRELETRSKTGPKTQKKT